MFWDELDARATQLGFAHGARLKITEAGDHWSAILEREEVPGASSVAFTTLVARARGASRAEALGNLLVVAREHCL